MSAYTRLGIPAAILATTLIAHAAGEILWDDTFQTKPVMAQGAYLYVPSTAVDSFTLLEPGRLQAAVVIDGTSTGPERAELGLWDPANTAQVHVRDPINSERRFDFSIELPANWPLSNHKTVVCQWFQDSSIHLNPPWSVEVVRDEFRFVRVINGTRTVLAVVPGVIGQRHAFVFSFRWATGPSGIARAWLNGTQVINTNGATLSKKGKKTVGAYFRMGAYLPGARTSGLYPVGFERNVVLNSLQKREGL